MKYIIKNVNTKQQLDELYNNSAFTITGLSEDSISDMIKWLEENTTFTKDDPIVYITKGKIMNDTYSLTGENRYPDDLNLVSVMDIDLIQVALPRFDVGGRWFDDIVDNDLRREEM